MKLRLAPTLLVAALGVALAATAWAALGPISADSRERVFEIPKGTWARRNAGEPLQVLPSEIHLTIGVTDVLVMRNRDDVPQMFGPVLIMPEQSFRMPFAVASSYQFACPAHRNGQLTVVVAPAPEAGWARLRWRLAAMAKALG
jgi:hypothetical protein